MSNVEAGGIGSNQQVIPALIGNRYSSTILTIANGTTPVTLVTGAPYYFITRELVEVQVNCTTSSATTITVAFTDSVDGILGEYIFWCPTTFAAPTVPTGPQLASTGAGFYYVAKTVGSSLQVSLSSSIIGGSVRVAVNCGICNFPGNP
jgi:hypothetical protein